MKWIDIKIGIAVGGVLLLSVTVLFLIVLRPQYSLLPDPVAKVVTYSTNIPEEVPPSETYEWVGGTDDPKKIVIPSIGVDSYVQNVGIDQNNDVAVPENIHLAGWFVESVRPGNKGLSIIDGHLNGIKEDGIFIHLEKLKPGDVVTVESGDGSSLNFAVKNIQIVDLATAAEVLYSQDPSIRHQLNLVTCGGEYDRDIRLYNKRVVVVSELM